MSVRERTGEIAVLKAMGFRRRQIHLLVLAESVAIATTGGTIGAVAAYVLLNAGHGADSPFLGPLGLFIMPLPILGKGIAIALAVGLVAGFLPARAAAAMSVTQALREVR